jgi:hypothetical protein
MNARKNGGRGAEEPVCELSTITEMKQNKWALLDFQHTFLVSFFLLSLSLSVHLSLCPRNELIIERS